MHTFLFDPNLWSDGWSYRIIVVSLVGLQSFSASAVRTFVCGLAFHHKTSLPARTKNNILSLDY